MVAKILITMFLIVPLILGVIPFVVFAVRLQKQEESQ